MTTTLGASVTQMSAAALSMATQNDPQFRLPRRACVVPGAVVAWWDDELVIDGTGSRRVLSGKSARRLLPDLLPLLDGRHELDELVRALPAGTTPAQVRAVLLLLFSCGLLQDGPMPAQPTDQELLLSRLLDTTRVNANVQQAQRRLTDAGVAVTAPEPWAGALRAELASVGLRVLDSGENDGLATDLAVLWMGGDPERLRSRIRALRVAGTPILPLTPVDGGTAVGPYTAEDHGPCPQCVLDQTPVPDPANATADPQIVAALVAIECTALLGRVGASAGLRGQLHIPADGGRTAVHFVAPRPGCPVCGDPTVEAVDPPPALRYEASVAFPARRLVNPRDHQHHFEAANIALQFEQRTFPADAVTVPLPDPALLGLDQAAGGDGGSDLGLDLSRLAAILGAAAGVKPDPMPSGKPARWAPTGGNLASPSLFVLARSVAGLAPGVWAYDPVGHRLIAVAPTLPQGWADRPEPATVIGAGALYRVSKKYRTFAYRIVHLDAGVALAHLALAARALDVLVRTDPAWPDASLRRALGLGFDTDAITAVLALGGPR